MNYWLVKSEPGSWSWDQQVEAGAKGTPWTGVRNHTAKQNLMKMKKGDRAFFYHSGDDKAVVGIAEVVGESHPDATAAPGDPWVAVDVKAVTPFKTPVSLAAIKAEPKLKDMTLVKQSRLRGRRCGLPKARSPPRCWSTWRAPGRSTCRSPPRSPPCSTGRWRSTRRSRRC
jgi:predicted RNA-binding protein with PUA-like domain